MLQFREPLKLRLIKRKYWFALAICISVALLVQKASSGQPVTKIEIAAGEYDRIATPVQFTLPDTLAGNTRLLLTDLESGSSIPCQRIDNDSAILIVNELKAKQMRRYSLTTFSDAARRDPRAKVNDDGRSLQVFVAGKPVLRYHTGVRQAPEGISSVYNRSGYIHPVFDPDGREVTDDFAPDHAHQHALFFAWVNTSYRGKKIDFWNQKGRTGDIRHAEVIAKESGDVFARFHVRQKHFDISENENGAAVIDEQWLVTVYVVDSHFVFDFVSTQELIGDQPLIINEYHYGGFALRGNRNWLVGKERGAEKEDSEADILTSEGFERVKGNHSRPQWTSMFGKIAGKHSSITVIDHPGNFRHPQPVRLHPTKPYFCQAPMVLGEFKLTPNSDYISRYRIIVSSEKPNTEFLNRCRADYANPPEVRFVGK